MPYFAGELLERNGQHALINADGELVENPEGYFVEETKNNLLRNMGTWKEKENDLQAVTRVVLKICLLKGR